MITFSSLTRRQQWALRELKSNGPMCADSKYRKGAETIQKYAEHTGLPLDEETTAGESLKRVLDQLVNARLAKRSAVVGFWHSTAKGHMVVEANE